jgi:hypothetical protein
MRAIDVMVRGHATLYAYRRAGDDRAEIAAGKTVTRGCHELDSGRRTDYCQTDPCPGQATRVISPIRSSRAGGIRPGTFRPRSSLAVHVGDLQTISSIQLPAVTHVDGSARIQTVTRAANSRFAALLDCFHQRTGCPILLNTSLNLRGEPIVCTIHDVISTFGRSMMDVPVLDDFLIERSDIPAMWRASVEVHDAASRTMSSTRCFEFQRGDWE